MLTSRPNSPVILLADPDTVLRNLLREFLEERGCSVISAADGEELLTLSKAHQGGVDLLVTEVNLPGLDGVSAYRMINAARPETKVLFISGDDFRTRAVPDGLPAVAKPFLLSALGTQIDTILGRPKSAGENPPTILVVDDNQARRDRTEKILRGDGYAVLCASQVEEAKKITDGAASIDLIISEVVFEGESGVELAEHVESSDRSIRTLLISHFHRDLLNGIAGFARQREFLPNPFTEEDLLKRVRQLLNRR